MESGKGAANEIEKQNGNLVQNWGCEWNEKGDERRDSVAALAKQAVAWPQKRRW